MRRSKGGSTERQGCSDNCESQSKTWMLQYLHQDFYIKISGEKVYAKSIYKSHSNDTRATNVPRLYMYPSEIISDAILVAL